MDTVKTLSDVSLCKDWLPSEMASTVSTMEHKLMVIETTHDPGRRMTDDTYAFVVAANMPPSLTSNPTIIDSHHDRLIHCTSIDRCFASLASPTLSCTAV